ncbi:unnamed protein product [Gordionus sp. m RMFG-2023]
MGGMMPVNNVTEIHKRRCSKCNSEEHLIQQCPSGTAYHKHSKKKDNNNKKFIKNWTTMINQGNKTLMDRKKTDILIKKKEQDTNKLKR